MTEVALKDLEFYLDDIAEKQLPFGCAMALTKTSAKIGEDMAKQAAHQFHTLTTFSRTHRTARIGAPPSPKSSFATLPADKNKGLRKMVATLGNQHWGISEQIADSPTIRLPKTSKYLWIPLRGRRKNYGPKEALKEKGVFISNTKKGTLILQRKGKKNKITPLFLRRRQQTIKPRFNMHRMVEQRAQRYMNVLFIRSMDHALRTAR